MNLIIMGAGNNGKFYLNNYIFPEISKYESIYFFDNNKSLWGNEICGKRVISIEELNQLVKWGGCQIVIAACKWKEFYKQCCELNIEEKIIDVVTLNTPFKNIEKNVIAKYGYVKSLALNRPVDSNDNPIPWYTYPAIEFLEEFDMSDKRVFEFGSGYSSYYWASRARMCVSVENNHEWYENINSLKSDNQEILFQSDKNKYADSILDYDEKFDVIIIDGRWRDLCAQNAIKCISNEGIIVLDNSDRVNWDDEYKKATEYMDSLDFIRVDFKGIGAIGQYAWVTSVYLSRNMRWKRKEEVSPMLPIGGLENN